jgi:hypothetical protein
MAMVEGMSPCMNKANASDANVSLYSFVEFETAADLKTAVEKLDNREFKGQRVNCVADVCFCSIYAQHERLVNVRN